MRWKSTWAGLLFVVVVTAALWLGSGSPTPEADQEREEGGTGTVEIALARSERAEESRVTAANRVERELITGPGPAVVMEVSGTLRNVLTSDVPAGVALDVEVGAEGVNPTRVQALTNRDGAFSCVATVDAPAGRDRLRALRVIKVTPASGWTCLARPAEVTRSVAGAVVTVEVEQFCIMPAAIKLRLVDRVTVRPIEGGTVGTWEPVAGHRQLARARTDADGVAEIAMGLSNQARLHIGKPGYGDWTGSLAQLAALQDVNGVAQIALEPRRPVIGRAVDEQGRPLVGATVLWLNRGPSVVAALEATTDENGEFRFARWHGEDMVFRIVRDGVSSDTLVPVNASRGRSHWRVELAWRTHRRLAGRVRDGNGQPCTGAEVRLLGGDVVGGTLVADDSGVFAADVVLSSAQAVIRVTSGRWSSGTRRVHVGEWAEVQDLVWDLGERQVLEFRLADARTMSGVDGAIAIVRYPNRPGVFDSVRGSMDGAVAIDVIPKWGGIIELKCADGRVWIGPVDALPASGVSVERDGLILDVEGWSEY